MKNKFKYKEVEGLGFDRFQMECEVFYEKNGYDDFGMEKRINNYAICWEPKTKKVSIQKLDYEGYVKFEYTPSTKEDVLSIIKLLDTKVEVLMSVK